VSDLLLQLARPTPVSRRLSALLVPHKVALLAIERQAAGRARESVESARTVQRTVAEVARDLRAVHLVSARLAARHAISELRLLGLDVPDEVPRPGVDYLNQLSQDVRPALLAPDFYLSPEEKSRRAALAAVSAANRVYREAARRNPGYEIRKMWVTNTRAGTPVCPLCLALNGKIARLDTEFRYGPRQTQPYVDLQGPPRHPFCRCRLVPRLYRVGSDS
jgi:hypothetical protein